jgi:ABC-2 type transport system permease protein
MRPLLASEWTKLRSVRSTYWSLLAAAVLAIAIGLLVCHAMASHWPRMTPVERAHTDLVSDNLAGFAFAQLAVGVLGVLVAGSEYSTGLIRLTFGAVPRRRAVLAAKAAVVGPLTLLVGVSVAAVTFSGGQAFLAGRHLGRSLFDPTSLRVVTGIGFYTACVALFGLGLGFLIRHTAGAITVLVAVVFLAPQLVRALPDPWGVRLGRLMFQNAATELVSVRHDDYHLAPVAAFALAAAWAATALVAAAVTLERRDV